MYKEYSLSSRSSIKNSLLSRCHISFSYLSTGLLKLQHIFRLTTDNYKLEVKVVKRIANASDANSFLHSLESKERESLKYVVLDCSADTARKIIVNHVRDIYMGRRNYHFLLTSLVNNHL